MEDWVERKTDCKPKKLRRRLNLRILFIAEFELIRGLQYLFLDLFDRVYCYLILVYIAV